jgi:hypothetical protein
MRVTHTNLCERRTRASVSDALERVCQTHSSECDRRTRASVPDAYVR